MRRIFLAIFIGISCSVAFAKSAEFSLVPTDCQITAADGQTASTKTGDKTTLYCKMGSEKFACGQDKKKMEDYKDLVAADGYIFAKSSSGNVFVLIDVNKGSFQIASSHLVPVEPAPKLMTKFCAGKLK